MDLVRNECHKGQRREQQDLVPNHQKRRYCEDAFIIIVVINACM